MKPTPTTDPGTVTRDERMVRITELRGAGACGSCGNPITWARTVSGSLMPLEPGLRVAALCSPELRQRVTVRVATKPGTTKHELLKTPGQEKKLVAEGWTVREELVLVWEIPASLTHWPNCPTADRHRRAKT